ncbi:MAG: threonylcarbamoyl-AMP synthase [Deltaproteobacteria bacterium]|nr:threonylcarbamoyl-AMP synthase [Deltaproteobacteria bacterium]
MGRIVAWREEAALLIEAEVERCLQASLLAAVPTETFYALAAHALDEQALARLFRAKGRPPAKPVLVLIAGPEMLELVAADIPEAAALLAARFWPGPLTLLLPARPNLPHPLTGGTGAVGVRQPRQEVTRRLAARLGAPITGTSANRAGRPPLVSAAQVDREFGDELSLIIDAGPCPGGLPSTIVDVSRRPARLVREGVVSREDLLTVIPDLELIRK